MDEQSPPDQMAQRQTRLTAALRRVVLLKETGPKSAAWHRARVRTIWRLHSLIAAPGDAGGPAEGEEPQL